MPVSIGFRSLGIGVVAAVVVVGAYTWGHSASAAPAARADVGSAEPSPSGGAANQGISVAGTGRVTGTPNLLRMQSSVNVTKPDVNSAMQVANTTMANVQKTLKSDGVADADLQTSGLSVQPNYNYSDKGAQLTGYTVSENLSVVLRDLTKAGTIISDAATAGGNALQIGSATLDLDGDSALIAQARQQAFADAKAKAQAYATAAGRSLGAVVSISESTNDQPQPMMFNAPMAAAASAPAVPIQAGSQDVTVTTNVTWSLN
ncbi:MAG: SIMPL domain-containing protein [Acidothermaceae bacterium]